MAEIMDQYRDARENTGSDAPTILGGGYQDKEFTEIRVRYYSGVMTNDDDRLMLEHIMTKSLQTESQLQNLGDVAVVNEQGTFDKEGCYHFVIKYMEKVESE